MHRESHSVSSRYFFTVWLAIVTAGFILLALPAVAGGIPLQWIYELSVLTGMSVLFLRQLQKSRLVFIYQFIGDELVVRRQAGGRISVCTHIRINEMEVLARCRDMRFGCRRRHAVKNLCGRPPRQKDYCLLCNGAQGKKAIIFEPSSRLVGLLTAKLKNKERQP